MSAIEVFLFYLTGLILVMSGLAVISLRNPIHCALALVLAFLVAAVQWLLLGAEFLAWVLVLVYVGAVMVLFLFVVMMLDISLVKLREGFWRFLPLGLIVAGTLAVQMFLVFSGDYFQGAQEALPKSAVVPDDYSSIRELGKVIYTDYLLAFELAAILLLVAIVAAISLTVRSRKDTKQLDPAGQVIVKADDRMQVVALELEKPAAVPDENQEPEPSDDGKDK